jgi:uncharacterized membrane protein YeaQ/YmgE (transglycosylase-associated protein family)
MVELMWSIIIAIFVGGVIGGLARLLLPGKQKISVTATVGIGILAALLGGVLAQAFGVGDTEGFDWIKFAIQVGFAMVGVGFYSGWFFSRPVN